VESIINLTARPAPSGKTRAFAGGRRLVRGRDPPAHFDRFGYLTLSLDVATQPDSLARSDALWPRAHSFNLNRFIQEVSENHAFGIIGQASSIA